MSSMELSFLVWKKRKGQVKESETSHLVDKSIRLNSEGCRLSRERPDGERVGSKVWEGPQDATGKAKGGSRHWARDLVGTSLPPGCRDPAFQAGSPLGGHRLPCPPDSAPAPTGLAASLVSERRHSPLSDRGCGWSILSRWPPAGLSWLERVMASFLPA